MPKVPLAVKHEFLLFVPVCCTSVPKRPRLGKRSRQDTSIQYTEVAAVLLSTTSEYDSGHRREKRERQGKKDFFFSIPSSFSTLRLKLLCA